MHASFEISATQVKFLSPKDQTAEAVGEDAAGSDQPGEEIPF